MTHHSDGIKRFVVTIAHDVIVYAFNEDTAKNNVLMRSEFKQRHNFRCVVINELPFPEDEPQTPIIDERKAPGS